MRVVASELATLGYFVVVGWVALWPARRRIGTPAYHVAALPIGLLSAAFSGAVAALTDRPLDMVSTVAGAALYIVVMQAFLRVVAAYDSDSGSFDPRSYLAAGGLIGVVGAFVALVRLTVSNNDSIVSYWPLGVGLSREGEFTTALIATRSVLVPSMNAIHVAFGSDWAYVIYPMLAATMLCWVVLTLARGPLSGAASKTVALVAGGAVVALVIEPSFIFHSLFVHSHMMSGLYLLMSLTSLWMAAKSGKGVGTGEIEVSYLVLAGAFTAGLAHARPDGLAYQFVPIAAAISVLTAEKAEWKRVLAYFGPLVGIVGVVFVAAYSDMGMWASSKLDGRTALGILGLLVFSAMGPWIVQGLERVTRLQLTGERFAGILVAVTATLTAAVLALRWETASDALATARINLFQGAGGYHYLWYAVVVLLVLSVLTGDALRSASWTRPAFLSIVLFFVVAGVIHGLSHEGRIGVGDSFNRVAFHSLPLVVWFVAAVVARILGSSAEERTA